MAAKADRYIRLGFGYAFPQAGQTRDVDGFPYNGSATIANGGNGFSAMEAKKASFGAGASVSIAGGHMITKNFGLELGAIVGVAPRKYTLDITGVTFTQQYEQKAKTPVFIVPALILQTGNKARLYMRGGLVLPVIGRMQSNIDNRYFGVAGTSVEKAEILTKTRFAIGFSGALGVKVPIAKKFDFWAEGNITSLSLYVKETELTKYEVDGRNVLGLVSADDKFTKYGNNMSGNREVTYSYPFSNIGINVGVAYNFDFGKNKKSAR